MFTASFGWLRENADWSSAIDERAGAHWRISYDGYDYVFNDKDLTFAREVDCQLACDALNDAGLIDSDVQEMSDEKFGQIVTSRLMW